MLRFVISLLLLSFASSKQIDYVFSRGARVFEQEITAGKVDLVEQDLAVRIFSERIIAAERELALSNLPGLLKSLGLTTLVDLVVKAGLASTLSGPGPFTVFAPTNKAFDNLPDWAKKAVSNITVLTNVLEYHVLAKEVPSTALKDELLVDTVLKGKQLRINIYTKSNNAMPTITAQCAPIDLSKVDQKASNGLAHVINAVMIPPSGNIVETVAACPVFKTLVTAVKAAQLVDALSGKGPFTLFAPTDSAFKKLPPGTLEKLLKNITALQKVLKYHVTELTYCSAGLATGLYSNIATLEKQDIKIDVSGGGVMVNNAKVVTADGSVTNGVVHAIDTVLLPPDLEI